MTGGPRGDHSGYSGFGMAMGLSAELVATTGVGLGLGWLADRLLDTNPIFLFIGALFGGAAGVVRLYRTWQRLTK